MKNNNDIDKEFSLQIIKTIDEYEKNTGKTIKKFGISYFEDEDLRKDSNFIANNVSKVRNCLYNGIVLKMYTGKELEYEGVEEEIREKYFEEKEEKMLCIEDKLYINQGY